MIRVRADRSRDVIGETPARCKWGVAPPDILSYSARVGQSSARLLLFGRRLKFHRVRTQSFHCDFRLERFTIAWPPFGRARLVWLRVGLDEGYGSSGFCCAIGRPVRDPRLR